LDQTNVSFICGIKVIFSTMNLYLFLKCLPSDLRSLSSLSFDLRSISYFCAITCTVTEVASGVLNVSNKELRTSVCLVEIYMTLMKQILFLKEG